jgi:hypothetical protein
MDFHWLGSGARRLGKMRRMPDKKAVRMLTLIARQVNNRAEWLSSAFYRESLRRGLFTH